MHGTTNYRQEGVAPIAVWYTGTDALKKGYILCWDRDNASAAYPTDTAYAAANRNPNRYFAVEKPAAGNLFNVAGIVTRDYPADAGGQRIVEITPIKPNVVLDVYCYGGGLTATTLGSTKLCVQAGSYVAGPLGKGPVIGVAYQTVAALAAGTPLVQAVMDPPRPLGMVFGTAAGRGPSPVIWESCPWQMLQANPELGQTFFSDFHGSCALANNQAITVLGEPGIDGMTAATAATTLASEDDPNGVCILDSTTINEDVGIQAWGAKNIAGHMKFTSGKPAWAEWRIKTVNITDSKYGLFMGFAEKAMLITNTLVTVADGALADKSYIGFHRIPADGDKFDIVYRTNGGAQVVHLADGITVVADTWMKLGLYFDGTSFYFYADGVLVGTALAYNAANVPDNLNLAFIMLMTLIHGDTASSRIDWLRMARLH